MRLTTLQTVLSVAVVVRATPCTPKSLVVDQAPQHLRPYVLPNMSGQNVRIGNQIYRFSVTGNSSGGAFTLMQTNAPDSESLGVLPHVHRRHFENFYCTKGRFQLWAQSNNNVSEQQTRVLSQGDYGAVPRNTTHTFQILDPDTQITGVIQPGGFESLFLALSEGTYDSATGSPFIPFNLSPPASSDPSVISALEAFDVYAELDFSYRTDAVNGFAGSGNWHNGSNSLAADAYSPAFVAKNYGPKYLHTRGGVYSVIAPLVTGVQSTDKLAMGTITMSPLLSNMTASPIVLKQHTAFQLQEGELVVKVNGYANTARLNDGDVLFVPSGTSLTYHASRPFTKFLYVSGGANGIDYDLMQDSIEWEYASYPQYIIQ